MGQRLDPYGPRRGGEFSVADGPCPERDSRSFCYCGGVGPVCIRLALASAAPFQWGKRLDLDYRCPIDGRVRDRSVLGNISLFASNFRALGGLRGGSRTLCGLVVAGTVNEIGSHDASSAHFRFKPPSSKR